MQAPLHPCSDHPYFPGEPPPEHLPFYLIWLALRFVVLGGVCGAVARYWLWFMKAARICALCAGLLLIPSPLFLIPFLLRQTGEWQALRRTLQAHESELRRYAAAHPGWNSKQIVAGFLRERPRLSEFRFADPTVEPLYFKVSDWRDTVPRIVVAYNACNNAVFDSDTMWVEVSD